MDQYQLQAKFAPASSFNWEDMKIALNVFDDVVYKTSLASERQMAARELQSNLTKLGLHQVSSIKLYYEDWYGKFELKEATLVVIRQQTSTLSRQYQAPDPYGV